MNTLKTFIRFIVAMTSIIYIYAICGGAATKFGHKGLKKHNWVLHLSGNFECTFKKANSSGIKKRLPIPNYQILKDLSYKTKQFIYYLMLFQPCRR